MYIEEGLNMEMVYKTLNDSISTGKQITKDLILQIDNKYKIQISQLIINTISFNINNDFFHVFVEPIKYNMFINNQSGIIINFN